MTSIVKNIAMNSDGVAVKLAAFIKDTYLPFATGVLFFVAWEAAITAADNWHPSDGAFNLLLDALRHPEAAADSVRRRAVSALRVFGPERIPPILEALQDPASQVRLEALMALWYGHRADAQNDEAVVRAAIRELRKGGDLTRRWRAVETLWRLFTNCPKDAAIMAHADEAVAALAEVLYTDPEVRCFAAEKLHTLQTGTLALPILREFMIGLTSDDSSVCRLCAVYLVKCDGSLSFVPRQYESLLESVTHRQDDLNAQAAAAVVLARIRGRLDGSVEGAICQLEDPDRKRGIFFYDFGQFLCRAVII